jgi:EpsI family protein
MTTPAAKLQSAGRRAAAVGCALAGVAVFQFFGNSNHGYIDTASLFYWWGFQWVNPDSETEHGWLILGLSVWLFARNMRAGVRDGMPKTEIYGPYSAIQNHKSAMFAMAAGLALHALGFAAQQTRISIVGFLVFVWGVLRLAGGKRWSGAAAFPLAFMVFAIPLNALDSLGFWLRMGVIDASAALAHTLGIGVLQSGTQLLAPDGRYNYDVAAACSGVRSLTALAALALLAGYLNFRSWPRRGLVLLACFPLVFLGNVARIFSIIVAAQAGGQAWGDRAHALMGYGVFAIVLGGVLAVIGALQRWWPDPAATSTPVKPAEGQAADSHLLGDKVTLSLGPEKTTCHLLGDKWAAGGALAIMALAAGQMFFLHHLATQPPRGSVGVVLAAGEKDPVELPAFLGREWTGRLVPVSSIEREILPADTGFSRRLYFNDRDPAKQVFLSIVLSGRDRTSIHRPELCLVGQGWTITGRDEHTFDYPQRPAAGAQKFPATVLRVRREVPAPATAGKPRGPQIVPQLTVYWFVSGDRVVASHWERFLRDAWNRVVHARADRWAYVLMQTDASDGEAAAFARLQSVLNETLPTFQRPRPGA